MIRSRKLPKDTNQRALAVVRLATEEPQEETRTLPPSTISQYLATIGRKGGLKGGKARAAKLSPAKRKAIAKKAAAKRWQKK